jgi:predicted phosphohydrolase
VSLFVIGDTHLSLSSEKPMDIFGSRWRGYVEKLEAEWRHVVGENDTVVIAGDISWGMTVEEAKADFDFIEALPGKKIILKGNHDYWWQTMAKLSAFIEKNEYKTITFMHNNAFVCEDFIICGCAGGLGKRSSAMGTPSVEGKRDCADESPKRRAALRRRAYAL